MTTTVKTSAIVQITKTYLFLEQTITWSNKSAWCVWTGEGGDWSCCWGHSSQERIWIRHSWCVTKVMARMCLYFVTKSVKTCFNGVNHQNYLGFVHWSFFLFFILLLLLFPLSSKFLFFFQLIMWMLSPFVFKKRKIIPELVHYQCECFIVDSVL